MGVLRSEAPAKLFSTLREILMDRAPAGPAETERRRQMVRFAVVCVAGLGIGAAAIHATLGDPARALVPLLALPVCASLPWLLQRSPTATLPTHVLCAFGSVVLIGSPLLGDSQTPVLIGLIMLPFAAALMGGVRAGLIWTLLSTAFLVAWAAILPFEGEARNLAWLTAISAAAVGSSSTYYERTRAVATAKMEAALAETRRQAETRVAAERELHRTRAIFESTFEYAPSILIVASLEDGRILDTNACFAQTTGWSAEEARGRTLSELGVWTHPEQCDALSRHAFAGNGLETVEIQLRTRSDESMWLLANVCTLHVEGEGYLLAQGIEITERKRAEREIAAYREQLEARVEEAGEALRLSRERLREQEHLSTIGTLAAGIAHQINNPIGGIVTVAQFALSTRGDAEREKVLDDALERILSEASRCGQITRNILKFARNEATAKWTNDLNRLVQAAAEAARGYVEERGGRLELALSEESLPIHGSPIDLEQVVVNLVRNAAEARAGGVSVRVQTAREGDLAVLSVEDDGPGFDVPTRRRAFDPFFTSRLADGGSGLGLSIVHGIVKDHGGQVDIRDSELGGARLRVGLPRLDEG